MSLASLLALRLLSNGALFPILLISGVPNCEKLDSTLEWDDADEVQKPVQIKS